MYGYKDLMVFCKFHPHKRCEHFCEFHTVLLCSVCLREKHRHCKIVEDHEFKNFYGRKIREAGNEIESEKHLLLENTDGIAHALDTGITRLGNYRRELDAVINRMNDMKNEVEHHRLDMRSTSQALSDIERSVSTATELKDCKKLYASVDAERGKFERRKQKVLLMPNRFKDEMSSSMSSLQKKIKSIRTSLSLQLNSVQEKQLYAGSPLPNKDKVQSSPFFDIKEKYLNKRSIEDNRFKHLDKTGRDSRRALLDDGRESRLSRLSRLRMNEKLPHLPVKPPRTLQPMPQVQTLTSKAIPVMKFTSYRPPSKPSNSRWQLT